jgi:hypothetical protein
MSDNLQFNLREWLVPGVAADPLAALIAAALVIQW